MSHHHATETAALRAHLLPHTHPASPPPAVSLTFRAGTVVPPLASAYAAANIHSFLQQSGGLGHLVVGPFGGQLLGSAAAVTLSDAAGNTLAST